LERQYGKRRDFVAQLFYKMQKLYAFCRVCPGPRKVKIIKNRPRVRARPESKQL
jgi:hypothetical protein